MLMATDVHRHSNLLNKRKSHEVSLCIINRRQNHPAFSSTHRATATAPSRKTLWMAQVTEAAFQSQANRARAADLMSHTSVTRILAVTGALRYPTARANSSPPRPLRPVDLWIRSLLYTGSTALQFFFNKFDGRPYSLILCTRVESAQKLISKMYRW